MVHSTEKISHIFRPDIQGLRALSVTLVVIYHIWPHLLTGGFVGVDVFFVISGFLITKHLLKEVIETGSISLPRFWSRRIRRLLPASFFVLFVSLFIAVYILPSHVLDQNLAEIVASVLYVENWVLIGNSIDYLSIENEPTLTQHFWSLSIEEQFYFIWPIIIFWLGTLDKIKYGLLVLFLFSLAYSIFAIENLGDGHAYFSLFTRVWEFSLGGLLVFFSSTPYYLSIIKHKFISLIASWFGLMVIIYSAITFSSDTDFPGYMALIPTFGAAVILLFRGNGISYSFESISRLYPIQFLGGISYSVYLWHWPLLLAIPMLTPDMLSSKISSIIILISTVFFAWISKKWVEDPVLKGRFRTVSTHYTFVFALGGMIIITLLAYKVFNKYEPFVSDHNIPVEQFLSIKDLQYKLQKTLVLDRWPEKNEVIGYRDHVPEWVKDHCIHVNVNDKKSMDKCVYGNPKGDKIVVVIGDSWATHFLPAIRNAFSSDWKIQVLTRGQCPIANVKVHRSGVKDVYTKCEQHRIDVIKWIKDNNPELVIVSDSPISTLNRLMSGAKGVEAINEIENGFLESYQALRNTGGGIIHIESPPRVTCSFEKVSDPTKCQSNIAAIFQRKISKVKIRIAKAMNFEIIDTTYWMCTPSLICPNQIGDVVIKVDSGHLTGNFSKMLGNILRKEVFRNKHD